MRRNPGNHHGDLRQNRDAKWGEIRICLLLLACCQTTFWSIFGFVMSDFSECLMPRNPGNRHGEVKNYPDASSKFVRMEFTENKKKK